MDEQNPRVFGKYEVIRRLAVGGMGEIFLARQTGMAGFDRLVILKSLLPQLATDPDMLTQFLDEARIVGSINHPNVVACYEVGEWEGVYFIAMEYINGVDIATLQKAADDSHLRLPVHVSMAIVREAALGLDSAHHAHDSAGRPLKIVHRDISPHNVMVREDGLAKVVDFGVAVAANRQKRTEGGLLKGKLGYMAPEQIKGQPLDGRSDQFSLGVMLWELLAGRRLFTAEDPHAVFMKIVKETVPPPSSIMFDVPKELDAVVLRMTAQEPTDRYPRLADAAATLRKLLDTRPNLEKEVAESVGELVGGQLAERVRDLTPVPVKILGIRFDEETSASATFCSSCGAQAVKGDRFCRSCGTALMSRRGTPMPSAPPPLPDDDFAEVADDMIDVAFDDASGPAESACCVGFVDHIVDHRSGVGAPVPAPEALLRPVFAHLEELASRHGGTVTTSGSRIAVAFSGNGRAARSAVAFARRAVGLVARAHKDLVLRAGVAATPGLAHGDTTAREDAERAARQARPGIVLVTARAQKLASVLHRFGPPSTLPPAEGAPKNAEPVTVRALPLPPRFTGRAGERIVVEQAVAAADVGRGQQHLFLGAAGSGKSAVLELVDVEARDRGFVVARARAQGGRAPLRYDLVRQVVRSACLELALGNDAPASGETPRASWRGALEALVPEERDKRRLVALVDGGDAGDDDIPLSRRRVLLRAAVLGFFTVVSERRGLCVLVDDVHRGDAPSLELFAEAGARLHATRFAVVAAGRPMQGERVLPLAKRTMLEPLEPKDLAIIASHAAGGVLPDEVATAVAARAAGSPLHASLLVRHLVGAGLLRARGGVVMVSADLAGYPLPPNLEVLLFALHARLPADARTALVAAAHAGARFEERDVEAMLETDAKAALAGCASAGFLVDEGDGAYSFPSSTEREAVAARADPATARVWHQRLARSLAERMAAAGTSVALDERTVQHLLAADDKAGAAAAAERAVDAWVRLGAPDAVLDHAKRALHHRWRELVADGDDEERVRRALDLGARATRAVSEADAATAVDLAMPLLRAVPEQGAVAERAAVVSARAAALARVRRSDEAEAAIDEALAGFAGAAGAAVQASLRIDLALVLEQAGDVDRGRAQIEEALRLTSSLPANERPRSVEALVALARLHLRARAADKAREVLEMALAEAARVRPSSSVRVDLLTLQAALEQGDGRPAQAQAALEQAAAAAEEAGDAVAAAKVHQQIARLHQQTGRFPEALAAARLSLSTAQRLAWDEGAATASQLVTHLEQRT